MELLDELSVINSNAMGGTVSVLRFGARRPEPTDCMVYRREIASSLFGIVLTDCLRFTSPNICNSMKFILLNSFQISIWNWKTYLKFPKHLNVSQDNVFYPILELQQKQSMISINLQVTILNHLEIVQIWQWFL